MVLTAQQKSAVNKWIKSLFPDGKEPPTSVEAEQFNASTLAEKFDSKALSLEAWQYAASRLAVFAADLHIQQEALKVSAENLRLVIETKRQQASKMQELYTALQKTLGEERVDLNTSIGPGYEVEIKEILARSDGDANEAIKRLGRKLREATERVNTLLDFGGLVRYDEHAYSLLEQIDKITRGTNGEEKMEPLTSPTQNRRRSKSLSTQDQKLTPERTRNKSAQETKPVFIEDHSDRRAAENIKRLRTGEFGEFYGYRDKQPYGEDFSAFFRYFERFAMGVDDETKLDELMKRLKGPAFKHMSYIPIAELTFSRLVSSLKAIFFTAESQKDKIMQYENLVQQEDEHLAMFQLRFEIAFTEHFSIVANKSSILLKDEYFKCFEFRKRLRNVLQQQLKKRYPLLFEEKDKLTFQILMEELRKIENEYPAGKKGDQKNKPPNNQSGGQNKNQSGDQNKGQSGGQNKGQSQGQNKNKNNQNYQRGNGRPQQSRGAANVPPHQGPSTSQGGQKQNGTVTCYHCNQPGHMKRDCALLKQPDKYQPYGNSVDPALAQRGRGRGRGDGRGRGRGDGRGRGRGGRGNNRGGMNVVQDYDYDQNYEQDQQDQQYYDQQQADGQQQYNYQQQANSQQQQQPALSVAEQLARNYMGVQTDPDVHNMRHVLKGSMMKCVDTSTHESLTIPRFNMSACKEHPEENPRWVSKTAMENTVDRIKDIEGWAKEVSIAKKNEKRPAPEQATLNSVKQEKWACIDDTRAVIPLIIEGVCVEDVLPDTGSMYNAISLKALWAMMGRFPSWDKAWETAMDWCVGEKHIQAAGGYLIPVLGVIRLNVQLAGKSKVPIYWAVYEDTEHSMVLGTKGMRALGLELKSDKLGGTNIIVPRSKIRETATKVYRSAVASTSDRESVTSPKDVTMATASPSDVHMKSISSNSMKSAETSLSAAMDVSFFETYGMKVPDNQQTCSNLSAVDLSNANKGYANVMQDADSPVPKSSESDEDFQDSWDEEGNSSPAYDC
jgi:hypothetical protein